MPGNRIRCCHSEQRACYAGAEGAGPPGRGDELRAGALTGCRAGEPYPSATSPLDFDPVIEGTFDQTGMRRPAVAAGGILMADKKQSTRSRAPTARAGATKTASRAKPAKKQTP